MPVNVNYRYVASELRYLYDDAGLVGLVFHDRFGPAVAEALSALRPPAPGARGGRHRAVARGGRRTTRPRWRPQEERGFRARSADDELLRLHRRHHRAPQGRALAPRGHLLRRHGRRRPLSLGDMIAAPEELAGHVLRPGMTALPTHRSCMPVHTGWPSPPSSAGARWCPHRRPFRSGRHLGSGRSGVGQRAGGGGRRHGAAPGSTSSRPTRAATTSRRCWPSVPAAPCCRRRPRRRLSELLPGRALVAAFGSSETGQARRCRPRGDPYGRTAPARRRAHRRARRRAPSGGARLRQRGAVGAQRPHPARVPRRLREVRRHLRHRRRPPLGVAR